MVADVSGKVRSEVDSRYCGGLHDPLEKHSELNGFAVYATDGHSHCAASHEDPSHPKMDIRFFNTFRFMKPSTWNKRLHDKIILVDREQLISGGRNIGDRYYTVLGDTNPKSDNITMEVAHYFDAMWQSDKVDIPDIEKKLNKYRRCKNTALAHEVEAYQDYLRQGMTKRYKASQVILHTPQLIRQYHRTHFNPRSLGTNTELVFLIDSQRFAKEFREIIGDYGKSAVLVTRKGKPADPEMKPIKGSLLRRSSQRVLSWLAPLYRGAL
jgi:hypothetical protein